MNVLVGATGLFGKTISEKVLFSYKFSTLNIKSFSDLNDKNIENMYLCCLQSKKYLVDEKPENDLDNIFSIVNHIKKVKPKNVILISTIDVYNNSPIYLNEDYIPKHKNPSYGSNRYFFETLIKNTFIESNVYIFRFPGVFGKFFKKNIFYDMINNNRLEYINVNSMHQWYDLNELNDDIEFFKNKYKGHNTFNLFSEPVETKEIIEKIFPYKKIDFFDERIEFNYLSKFYDNHYRFSKDDILLRMHNFASNYKK